MFACPDWYFYHEFCFSPCRRREEVKAVIPEVSEHLLTNSVLCQCASVPSFEMPSYASPIAANICCSSTLHTLLTLLFFSTSGLNHKQVHWANLTQYLKLKLGSLGRMGGGRHVAALLLPDWGKTTAYPVQIFAHANLEFVFHKHLHV